MALVVAETAEAAAAAAARLRVRYEPEAFGADLDATSGKCLSLRDLKPEHMDPARGDADAAFAAAADAPRVEALLVPDPDPAVDPLGLKGLGEPGIIGVNAAIANAVHHATGLRLRSLPIRCEHLL